MSELAVEVSTENRGLDAHEFPPLKEFITIEVQESTNKIDTNSPVHQNNNMAHKGMTPLPNGKLEKDLDELVPATNLWTCDRDDAVKLRIAENGPAADKPFTVPSLLYSTAQRIPNNIALAVKRGGTWVKWTYQQYYHDIKRVAKSFIRLGLEPYHGVGILGFNSPEWFLSDLGAIFAGGFAVGIYATNNAEACEYVARNSEANIIVVENHEQLEKILQIWDRLPHLKAVIQYTGEVAERRENLYSWEEFMELSSETPDSALHERLALQAPNKCCTLIFTSGTTGNPKGVMLSHDNVTWTATQCGIMAKLTYGNEVTVSYLPLSHIAAQMLDLYITITFGGAVYFGQPDALKGSLSVTLKEVHPTAIMGVPRVWEKIMETMVAIGKQASPFRKKVSAWARDIGLKGNYAKMEGSGTPFGWSLANALVFKKVRAALGFQRCKMCVSGAAPVMKETLEFFYSLNIPLLEVYGMSESTGPQTFCSPEHFYITSVGQDVPGTATKLNNPDEDGNGEVYMYGRNVFMGYLDNLEKTQETIDGDGWLLSGDIGKKNKDGFLFITGRLKELIITAGGENIAPVPIEENVKECLPIVSQCMLVGDKCKFLSMLITLKTEIDQQTAVPKEELTQDAIEWCVTQGSTAKTISDIVVKKDFNILKAIQAGIDKANSKAVSRASKIQKWSILPRDFSIPGGELGPTLKLRRPIVSKMYLKTINAFYVE